MAQKKKEYDFFSDELSTGVAYKNKLRKRKIIRYLDQNGEAIIAELAQAINISTPKTTSLINELIEEGLISDYGKIDSTGGRPASIYGLVADSCFFIGIDVKQYYVNIGLLDFKKNLRKADMKIPFLLENNEASLHNLIRLIKEFIKTAGVDKTKILSLCVNLGGRINTNSGSSYSYFHFNEQPLSVLLEKQLSIRSFIENDSRAMAYGEFHKGIVKNEKNVLFMNLDYGLGLGVMIEGQVYYGKSGFSGEIGHIPFFNNEILCHCGKKGCLETEASGIALLRMFKEKMVQGVKSSIGTKKDIRLNDIIDAAKHEDMLSIDLLAAIGEKIGRGIAVLINILNSEMVILGGTLASTGDYIFLPVKSALNKYSLNLVSQDTKLVVSELGEKAGLIGGCLIARNKLLL
ncbi:Sugar kinase of the NBD/HSP70 family, may contain an N-terminal HTH domain [Niabella drilacis]|uniref:Sugar kinase of the NBD/HSP70 family, may contain an N-terminal HTH domain n=2 Tax=Niabella drilacis (strain DSM 25811 / CCM 8410 / CCUG 62505 / LMG 26954 / E90) TaxID=1285928 RepID=A0A1G6M421_NIADE|nr:Sugar kinase of the NBD/HSP70 family, may contain an N-terminal HTH domain [Niabella drilacis]